MHMSNIKLTYPYLLFLIIPLVILSVVIFFFIPKQKKRRINNLISLGLHIVLSVTLPLAFSDLQVRQKKNDTEMYVVVDCSDSEKGNVEKLDAAVKSVYDKASEASSKAGVVCFGKNSFVLVKPGEKLKSVEEAFDDKKHPDFERDASDIASALNYTKGLYSDKSIKKLVLVSDGLETDNSAIDTISTLLGESIAMDSIYLNNEIKDEVSIKNVDYIDHCFTNREQTIQVLVQSTGEKNAKILLESKGEVLKEQETVLASGLNVFSFLVKSDKVCSIDYEVEIKPESDTFSENNTFSFTQDYSDDFSVLFIGNAREDLDAFKAVGGYSDNVKIKSYVDTANVPYKLNDLLKYDEIVLDNMNVMSLNHYEEFTKNLKTAVSSYGKSLLTYGATYTSGSIDAVNDYSDLLPIQYEADGSKALALVIDTSDSMTGEDRMEIAKKGAIRCLDVLSDDDYVSIIGFNDTVQVYQPLTSIKNKNEIIKSINKMTAGGGTMLSSALRKAQDQVYDSSCEYKNVITLSDGMPGEDDAYLERIVKNMASDNIVCSFINIASDEGKKLLSKLSELGNGKYYFCRTAAGLVDVMLSSVSAQVGNTEINETAQIQYKSPDDPVLNNVQTLPDLTGYNYCRVKGGSNTVLTVQYKKKDENNNIGVATIPIFAYWNFGKGQVASFTSNLTSDWTKSFRSSKSGKQFLNNIIYQTLPERKATSLMDMTATRNGTTMGVSILVDQTSVQGKIHVKTTNPNGVVSETDLSYDSKNRTYLANIPVKEKGKYQIEATYSEADEKGNYVEKEKDTFSFYYDFSGEYDVLPQSDDFSMMSELAKAANGRFYEKAEDYVYQVSDSELNQYSYFSTMTIFFLVSVLIYLADIFVRKSHFKSKKKPTEAQ